MFAGFGNTFSLTESSLQVFQFEPWTRICLLAFIASLIAMETALKGAVIHYITFYAPKDRPLDTIMLVNSVRTNNLPMSMTFNWTFCRSSSLLQQSPPPFSPWHPYGFPGRWMQSLEPGYVQSSIESSTFTFAQSPIVDWSWYSSGSWLYGFQQSLNPLDLVASQSLFSSWSHWTSLSIWKFTWCLSMRLQSLLQSSSVTATRQWCPRWYSSTVLLLISVRTLLLSALSQFQSMEPVWHWQSYSCMDCLCGLSISTIGWVLKKVWWKLRRERRGTRRMWSHYQVNVNLINQCHNQEHFYFFRSNDDFCNANVCHLHGFRFRQCKTFTRIGTLHHYHICSCLFNDNVWHHIFRLPWIKTSLQY